MSLIAALTLPDGVVLGTDGATTYTDYETDVSKLMLAGDKLARLAGRPIGVATCGLAYLGSRSIGNLLHEFQHALAPAGAAVTLGAVSEELRRFFATAYRETITQDPLPLLAGDPGDSPRDELSLTFVVAGYSPSSVFPEVWHVEIAQDNWPGEVSQICRPGDFGADWFSMYDPILRYVFGYDRRIVRDLDRLVHDICGFPAPGDFKDRLIQVLSKYEQPVPYNHMPLEMGVAYVRSLITLAIDYYRFSIAEEVIGGEPRIGLVTYNDREFCLV
jgi:hypothetical protein